MPAISASADTVEVEQRWWRSFGDPALDRLIGLALAGNKSLQIAAARAAERDFAASRAGTEAARKEIFPGVSLTALLGIQHSSAFDATPWGAGASLAMPLIDFGRIEADIDAADARQQEAFRTYQQSVLEGLADMEDALALYAHEWSRQHALAAAAQGNRKAVELADRQYKAGYTGLLDLLVAERDELAAESSLASSDAQLRQDLVRIDAAAGGGWAL